ncbi:MAG: ABC transporter substrate-binding protein [Cyanobacteria bacterium P01_C01_bin.118]
MFNLRWRNLATCLVTGALLVSCQSTAVVPLTTVPSRTIAHAKGKSKIPISLQRVVVLDTAPLDGALALGIKPVGTMVYGDLPKYLGDKVNNIEIVGDNNEPNLETVLKLKPDLILGTKISVGKIYRQLSQIAPTVLTAGSGRAGE